VKRVAFIPIVVLAACGCGWLSGRAEPEFRPTTTPASPAAAPAEPSELRQASSTSLSPTGATQAAGPSRIVAASMVQVNDRFITLEQILHAIRRELRAAAAGASEVGYRTRALELIRAEVRRQVERTVLLAEAEKQLPEEEKKHVQEQVEGRLRLAVAEIGSRAEFVERLRAEGMDLATWQEDVRQALMMDAYMRRRFGTRIEVTRRRMWAYYRANREKYRTRDQAQMQIIAAPYRKFTAPGRAEQAVRRMAAEQIQKAVAALDRGEDFGEVAKQYSAGAMADNGGVWPMMERGSFRDTAVEDAAFAQEAGEVSKVIETDLGVYVVKTLARRAGASLAFEQVQDEIATELRRQQYAGLRREYLQQLEAGATVHMAERFEQVAVEAAVRKFYRTR